MDEIEIERLLDSGEHLAYRGPVSESGQSLFLGLTKCEPDDPDLYPPTALSEMPSYVAHQTMIRTHPYDLSAGELSDTTDLEVLINEMCQMERRYFQDLTEVANFLADFGAQISQLRRYSEVQWWPLRSDM